MRATNLTAARVRQVLHYDPLTGVFTWLVPRGTMPAGSIAGGFIRSGYRDISIDDKKYKAHRVAWLIVTGQWPDDQIDHRDMNRANNAWSNLREADNRLNQQNKRHAQKNNQLGILGVRKEGAAFRAQIRVQGKQTHLGYFTTPELAHAAYVAAKRIHHAGGTL